jgi:protein involved in polysaccharide export with SLBB domain
MRELGLALALTACASAPRATPIEACSGAGEVTISGQVAHPGRFALAPGMTARDLVLAAGGFTPVAGRDLYWRHQGRVQQLELDEATRAPELCPGDELVVPFRE